MIFLGWLLAFVVDIVIANEHRIIQEPLEGKVLQQAKDDDQVLLLQTNFQVQQPEALVQGGQKAVVMDKTESVSNDANFDGNDGSLAGRRRRGHRRRRRRRRAPTPPMSITNHQMYYLKMADYEDGDTEDPDYTLCGTSIANLNGGQSGVTDCRWILVQQPGGNWGMQAVDTQQWLVLGSSGSLTLSSNQQESQWNFDLQGGQACGAHYELTSNSHRLCWEGEPDSWDGAAIDITASSGSSECDSVWWVSQVSGCR